MSTASRWRRNVALAICSLVALEQKAPALQSANRLERASSAIQLLLGWFDENTGLYKTTGWWNSANVTTVLADYSRVSKSKQHFSTLANTFVAAQNAHLVFLNKYYDDEGCLVLAWLDAYDLTGNRVHFIDGGIYFRRYGRILGRYLRRRHLVEQRSYLQKRHRERIVSFDCRPSCEPRLRRQIGISGLGEQRVDVVS